MDIINAPRGTRDILGREVVNHRTVESIASKVFERWGYEEIITPVFEHRELFIRSIGDTTDIVEKEMYSFQDKKERWMVLRPEGTAAVVRAMIEHKRFQPGKINREFYRGSMYRYERPQAGRYREFYQVGAELFGVTSAYGDWEVIMLGYDILKTLKLDGEIRIELNSLGCKECRPKYREALLSTLISYGPQLCGDCKNRITRNPLRVLDCKIDAGKIGNLPSTLEYLCDECKTHFELTTSLLKKSGVEFSVNPKLVRGLDYYTRTVFEIKCAKLGAQDAVAAGGRYDGLVAELGGPAVPAVGLAFGVDRLSFLLSQQQTSTDKSDNCISVIAAGSTEVLSRISLLARDIRNSGFNVYTEFYDSKSMKAQMRYANELGVRAVLIYGEDEHTRGVIQMKDMNNATQAEVKLSDLFDELKKVLEK
ncbi:MAG: histidine--tRNA ligase [Elusimicrobiota bacterium]